MRLAMWSGPRNLSTAMMYAFAQREDFAVADEPFYAAYLAETGLAHPMRDAVIAAQPVDPARVVAQIKGSIPGGKPHFYLKHMAHHMLPHFPRSWLAEVTNAFLIRHPARVVASFAAKYENPRLDDLGFLQQAELFELACSVGRAPVVIDSADILADPPGMLAALCAALDLDFDEAMLNWPPGGHPADGVWAAHWYASVHASTGFGPPEGPLPRLEGRAAELAAAAMPAYEKLAAGRLTR